jgi:hypothetical protein
VGKLTVKFVRSEKNEADINMKNVSVRLLQVLAKNVRKGNCFARQTWEDILRKIDMEGVLYTHATVHMEDIEIWICDFNELLD